MQADLPDYLKTIQSQLQKDMSAKPFASSSLPPSLSPPSPLSSSSPSPSPLVTQLPKVKDALRFMLVSTHLQQYTGYSRVSHGIIGELSKQPNLELTHYGFQRIPKPPANYRPYPPNVDVIDAAETEQPPQQGFGFVGLPDVIRKKKPHVVMIYNDMSIVTKFVEEIRKSGVPRDFKLWVYVDQVYTCQLQGYLDILNRDADRIFTFTQSWKKCLKSQGINRPIDVITHGFDSKTYFPVPKELVRKQLGIPNDAFVLLNLNRNQPRKRYDILIMAFVELIVKNPQKPIFLLCICDKGEKGGWWLFEIFKRELELRNVSVKQFESRLMISSQDMNFKDEDINLFYNVADLGINTCDGEGWGLCNFEQMGVGIPQVLPDVGGFKEYCNKDNSVLVKPTVRYYMPMVYSPVGGEAEACNPHDICMGVEEYLFDSEKREKHGKAARETVMKYTWESSTATLLKRLLDERKERIEEGEL